MLNMICDLQLRLILSVWFEQLSNQKDGSGKENEFKCKSSEFNC